MHHDDNVGARCQRLAVTGLLIASVPVIAVVDVVLQAESMRDFDSAVGAVVIHQDPDIHQVGQLPYRYFQRLFRVVGGQHHRDALAVNHSEIVLIALDLRS